MTVVKVAVRSLPYLWQIFVVFGNDLCYNISKVLVHPERCKLYKENKLNMSDSEIGGSVRTDGEIATVFAGDYLNKLTGEAIERECRTRLTAGCKEIVVNFSRTEIVNSIGVSILLGVIDSAKGHGARVVFSDLNQNTIELFDMLGVTKHVDVS